MKIVMPLRKHILSIFLLTTLITGMISTSFHIHTSSDDHKQTTQCHTCHYITQCLSEGSNAITALQITPLTATYECLTPHIFIELTLNQDSVRAPPLVFFS